MNWGPDLIRAALRLKYARTGEWTDGDRILTAVLPRSPLSAGMWVARMAASSHRPTVDLPPYPDEPPTPTLSEPEVTDMISAMQ